MAPGAGRGHLSVGGRFADKLAGGSNGGTGRGLEMNLRVGAVSDTGRVRKLNEDAYAARADQGWFVVCDGMGGARAGEVASRLAVDTIIETLAGNGPDAEPSPAEAGYRPLTLKLAAAVRRSNVVIFDQSQSDTRHAGMGTTVVGACLADGIASIAHVGDSRAYLWRGGALEPLTRDHSVVQMQVNEGLLAQEESLQSEQQNLLLRALGHRAGVDVDVAEVPVQPGDYLLLCTDGLTRMVPDAEMARTIADTREPQAICRVLMDEANRGGGPDNVTVVVVELKKSVWGRLWGR
jgi:protein phosphatase